METPFLRVDVQRQVTKLNKVETGIDWDQTLEDMREDTEAKRRDISPPIRQFRPEGDTQYRVGWNSPDGPHSTVVLCPTPDQKRIEEIMNDIISIETPEGRNMTIINGQVYQEIWKGHRPMHYFVHLLLRDNPDGIWDAEGHTARFTIKDGKVMATELLYVDRSPIHLIKEEMKEKCGKTIFFRSKIEGY